MIKKPAYEDEESKCVDRLIPKNVTTEALKAFGATINFIYIWLKLLKDNYEVKSGIYKNI